MRGRGGPDAFFPFVFGIALIGAVAGLLSWQLSRVITTARKREDWAAKQGRPIFMDVQPQAHLVTPTDPIRSVVENPSVVEHTTRQMASVHKIPAARE
ncbi:MAG TPA: hypothetical protein VJ810_42550 [Blastocatellia bacterium]|nr:hypothetical protein [Blastocatellia bacterium]